MINRGVVHCDANIARPTPPTVIFLLFSWLSDSTEVRRGEGGKTALIKGISLLPSYLIWLICRENISDKQGRKYFFIEKYCFLLFIDALLPGLVTVNRAVAGVIIFLLAAQLRIAKGLELTT